LFVTIFPWGSTEFPENSLSFPRSEKSLSIPGFPGLWPPCSSFTTAVTHVDSLTPHHLNVNALKQFLEIVSPKYSSWWAATDNSVTVLYHLCTGWPPKNWHTEFQNSFTVRVRRKFVITVSREIPPHLNCVATLPCVLQKHHDAAFFLQSQDLFFKTFYLFVHLM